MNSNLSRVQYYSLFFKFEFPNKYIWHVCVNLNTTHLTYRVKPLT